MVSSSVDRRDLVCASWETSSHISGQDAVNSSSVQALEERKFRRVGGSILGERRERLDDYVRMANDLATRIQLLGCSKVVLFCIDKVTSLHALDGQGDRERCVCRNVPTVGRECEFSRWHVGRRWDKTHWCRVARSFGDLETIGDLEIRPGRTEVDEVVSRREGRNLAGFLDTLA